MPDDSHIPEDELVDRLLKSHRGEEVANLFDRAINLWLDRKFAQFGKWSAAGIAALVLAALIHWGVHTGVLK